jgi:hypothetical protein
MRSAPHSGSTLLVALAPIVAACAEHPLAVSGDDEVSAPLAAFSPAVSPAVQQSGPVYRFEDVSAIGGATASLLRNPSGLHFTIRTAELPPGDAVTIWWVVFNFPEYCEAPVPGLMQCSEPDLFGEDVAATVLHAAGNVIGGSGRSSFAGALRTGDLAGCSPPMGEFGLCREGLLNPEGAEVHLVVRTHGQRLPGLVREQIRSFAGGCTPETSFGAGTGPNVCTDLQFAIFLAP